MKKYKLIARRNFVFQLLLMALPMTVGIILTNILAVSEPMIFAGIITVFSLYKLAEYIYLPKIIKTKYGYIYYILTETETGTRTYIDIKKDNIVGWKHLISVKINPEDSREKILQDVEKGYERYLKLMRKIEIDKTKSKTIENKLNNLSQEPSDILEEELKRLEYE